MNFVASSNNNFVLIFKVQNIYILLDTAELFFTKFKILFLCFFTLKFLLKMNFTSCTHIFISQFLLKPQFPIFVCKLALNRLSHTSQGQLPIL